MKNGQKMKMGIRTKLTSMFVLLIMIPLLTLGMSDYMKSVKIMEENLKESSLQLTNEIKTSINNMMNGFEESTVQMASDANVQQVLESEENAEWMMKGFASYIKGHPDAQSIYLGTKNKGMLIYPKDELPEGYDPTERGWYKEAVSKNSLIWTDSYVDAITGKVIITVAMPVYDSFNNNEFIGVLGVDISLETLSNHINTIQIGKKGYPIILDRNLEAMTHKNKDLIGKPIPIEEVNKAIKEKNEGYVDYEWQEEGKLKKKFGVFTKIDKLGWTILATMYVDEIKEDTKALLGNAVMIGSMALFIALLISYVFSRKLTQNIKLLVEDMERIKDGDLTVYSEVKSNDEMGKLGESFNFMVDELGKLVKNVQNVSRELIASAETLAATSEETSASSEEVAKTVEEIAKGATDQAADAEKGAMLTSKLADKFNELTHNTGDMLNSTNEVMGANLDGIKAIDDLKDRTEQNSEATEKIEGAISELDNKTKYIGNILDTIASIAEQTNLLALNASIEAARAGEHGKGFAVVADEIRKLAEGSRSAADEIKEIVINIQSDSNHTVEIMKEVKVRSQEQSYAVCRVSSSFDRISKSIDNIAGKIETISQFVNHLNKDKDAIVGAIENISAVSEETAAASEEVSASMQQQSMAVEEVARAADHLNGLAVKLNEEITRFKI